MDVAAVEHSGGSRDPMTLSRGVRTYALQLWPLQYLSGMTTAVAVLALMIPSNADAPFATGSAILLAVSYGLPFITFSPAGPLGGLLTERWGPKKTIVGSNIGYLVLIAVALVAWAVGTMPAVLVWALLLCRVACQSVQLTALESSVPALLPKRLFPRANGSRMFLTAGVAAFEAPIALATEPILGVVPILLIAGCVALVSILFVYGAEYPPLSLPAIDAAGPADIQRGYIPLWAYIRGRRGFLALLGFFAAFNFVVGFVEVGEQAVVNGFASSAVPNIMLGGGLLGLVIATVWITARGTPRDSVRWLFIFSLVFGAALVAGGFRANVLLDTAAAFVFLGCAPFIMAIISTLLHTKTEPGLMGRMMGVKMLVVGIFYGAGNVIGALCSSFVRTLMGGDPARSTGFLTDLVGAGRSYGRGYAFLIMVVGVLVIAAVVLARRSPALRDLDTNLPDVTAEDLRSDKARPQ